MIGQAGLGLVVPFRDEAAEEHRGAVGDDDGVFQLLRGEVGHLVAADLGEAGDIEVALAELELDLVVGVDVGDDVEPQFDGDVLGGGDDAGGVGGGAGLGEGLAGDRNLLADRDRRQFVVQGGDVGALENLEAFLLSSRVRRKTLRWSPICP